MSKDAWDRVCFQSLILHTFLEFRLSGRVRLPVFPVNSTRRYFHRALTAIFDADRGDKRTITLCHVTECMHTARTGASFPVCGNLFAHSSDSTCIVPT
jgi:hypothetical protein